MSVNEPVDDFHMDNDQQSDLPLWTSAPDGAVKLRMEESGPLSLTPITIHELLQQAVDAHGERTALAWLENGTWENFSFRQYQQECRKAAKSFLKLGLERYHGVGILGFNSPEWFITAIGTIMAGGFAVGIYTTNSPEACLYIVKDCKANVVVVENDKQLKKILQIKDELPHLKAIVQYKDELKVQEPIVYTWKDFVNLGADVPDLELDDIISSQKANHCCSLIYTSGTTGTPKGVMLSHDNLTWTAEMVCKTTGLRQTEEQDIVVSYLPLSHIAAQMIDVWITMKVGAVVYFAQPDALKGSLVTTMREVRPTGFMGVPRVWEKMMERMKAVGEQSGVVIRLMSAWARNLGLQANLSAMDGKPYTPWGWTLASSLVFRKVREALGLDRCSRCFTGAAPITRDTLEFFLSLNIPVYELYGMSESSGPHAVSIDKACKMASCGREMIGCSTKIENCDGEGNGEVCFWGRHVFMGYLNMEKMTQESLDTDGWLHSGDIGRHDDQGFLYITGRLKEIIITAGGENIPPIPLEDAVKEELSFVSNAMLVGDRCKFLSMLLTPKCKLSSESGEPLDELSSDALRFCQEVGSSSTRPSQIAWGRDQAVNFAISRGIGQVNERCTSHAQRIQKWAVLEKDFTTVGGELGPTMKLKRPVVLKMYREVVDKFYAEAIATSTPK